MSQVASADEDASTQTIMGGVEWQASKDARNSSDPLLIKNPVKVGPATHSNSEWFETSFQPLPERSDSIQKNPPFDHWRIHWAIPSSMVVLFIIGILSGLAHHLYYDSLHHKPSDKVSQEFAVRIGTSLAFLFKACLCASAAMAYRQYYWTILRTRDMSIRNIDNIMGLLSDPTCFASLDTLRDAFSCVITAIIIWCIPLSAIAPPASLTVGVSVSQEVITEEVPHIDWGLMAYTPGRDSKSFADTSQETYRTVSIALYSNTILPMTAKHQNYSYSLTFNGPRLRCGDVDDQSLLDQLELETGDDSMLYNATTDFHPYSTGRRYDIYFFTPQRNFSCETWNTTYTAEFTFINGMQNTNITNIHFDHHLERQEKSVGPVDGNVHEILGYAGWYTALTSILEGSVSKTNSTSSFSVGISTNVLQTPLVACPEMEIAASQVPVFIRQDCPGKSLEHAIEVLSERATLSFFASIPGLYARRGISDPNMTYTTAPITISTTELLYFYNKRSLIATYSTAIGFTLLILFVGFYAMLTNGVNHSSSFSGILCTTRNPNLDTLTEGYCLGSQPLSSDLGSQRLQYGLLKGAKEIDTVVGHASFGTPDSILTLRKSKTHVR